MLKKICGFCAWICEVLGTCFMVIGFLNKSFIDIGLMAFFMLWAILFIIEANEAKKLEG